MIAVYFTHGDSLTEDRQARTVSLGKALLVSQLQVLLQSERMHLPRTAEAETLARELLDDEIHVDEKANDTYGAFRVGSHDDQVTAPGLAVEVLVVNAQHIKQVPGRKTDVTDAAWIAGLLPHGLLRPSYIPDRAQRELRELTCYRKSLADERSAEVNRLQKTLEGAN